MMWRLESHVNGSTVTTVLASLKIAYLAIHSLRRAYPSSISHIVTRLRA